MATRPAKRRTTTPERVINPLPRHPGPGSELSPASQKGAQSSIPFSFSGLLSPIPAYPNLTSMMLLEASILKASYLWSLVARGAFTPHPDL